MKKAILVLAFLTTLHSGAQTVLSPRPPALQPTLILTNQFATNIFPAGLAARLVSLQNELQQLLPLLAAFNDSFDFIGVRASASPATTGGAASPGAAGPAVNLSTDLSTVSAVGLGQDLGTSLAVPTSSPLALTPPAGTTPVSTGPVTAVVNAEVGLVPTLGGPNGAVGFNSARDALRGLLILQDDIERMLPIVATVNLSTNSIAAFQTGTPGTALTPTGR